MGEVLGPSISRQDACLSLPRNPCLATNYRASGLVLLALREIERRLGLADRLAGCLRDPRMPEKVVHRLAEITGFAC